MRQPVCYCDYKYESTVTILGIITLNDGRTTSDLIFVFKIMNIKIICLKLLNSILTFASPSTYVYLDPLFQTNGEQNKTWT